MMVSVTDLRSGAVFEDQGRTFQVISYEHIKMGRGSATIKVKVRDIRSGANTDKSFINGAKVKNIKLIKKLYQYLYKDTESVYFMNSDSFEQLNMSLVLVPQHQFLKEGETYQISFIGEEALEVSFPPKIELKVIETGPTLRGNSATNIYKDAILENGIKTKVPLFIKQNESVRIDTRTGEYTEKA